MKCFHNIKFKKMLEKSSHSAQDVIEDDTVAHSNRNTGVYFYFSLPVPMSTTEPAGSHSGSESIAACQSVLHSIHHVAPCTLHTWLSSAVHKSEQVHSFMQENLKSWAEPNFNSGSLVWQFLSNSIHRMQANKFSWFKELRLEQAVRMFDAGC